jgi:hypothetical protein
VGKLADVLAAVGRTEEANQQVSKANAETHIQGAPATSSSVHRGRRLVGRLCLRPAALLHNKDTVIVHRVNSPATRACESSVCHAFNASMNPLLNSMNVPARLRPPP